MALSGFRVLLAASGPQRVLLQAEFPQLEMLELKGYGVRYAVNGKRLVTGLILRIPAILNRVRQEHSWVKKLCRERKIDAVISDNRYGLYCPGKWNVFITHQLYIQSGLGSRVNRMLFRLNQRFIRRFSVCWVPDNKGPDSLAGLLSHPPLPVSFPVVYGGLLSRFTREKRGTAVSLLILISGPEPQRTLFEEKVFHSLDAYSGEAVVLRGLPGQEGQTVTGERIRVYNHLEGKALNGLVNAAECIVARSGYSTIMDLAALRKKAVLIPTPGQTEQEWLAGYLDEKNWARRLNEEAFSIGRCLELVSKNDFGFPAFQPGDFAERLTEDLRRRLNVLP
ncbi:MAG TPA: glycosyltransferase [Puia sp.]|nr:glycosyltransferase [Puia sp.]